MIYSTKSLLFTILLCAAALNVLGAKPTERSPVLVEIKDVVSNSKDPIYHYKCTAGFKRSDSIQCEAEEDSHYDDDRNVQLRLRCPKEGTTNPIEYAQIDMWVSSQNVQCEISDGCIGCGFIEMLINVDQTKKFQYKAMIYAQK